PRLARAERDPAVCEGVLAPRSIHATARRGALTRLPPRPRVGLRVREPVERRRRVHPPPPQQDRRAVRPQDPRDDSRRGLPVVRQRRTVRRLPIRVRVAGAFALAMAVVLVATGWFLYVRLDSHLRTALDNNLRVRAQDLATVVRDADTSLSANQRTHVVEPGESYAQLRDLHGPV